MSQTKERSPKTQPVTAAAAFHSPASARTTLITIFVVSHNLYSLFTLFTEIGHPFEGPSSLGANSSLITLRIWQDQRRVWEIAILIKSVVDHSKIVVDLPLVFNDRTETIHYGSDSHPGDFKSHLDKLQLADALSIHFSSLAISGCRLSTDRLTWRDDPWAVKTLVHSLLPAIKSGITIVNSCVS